MKHAIIGCGSVAPNHAYGIKFADPEVILVCCDKDEQKAQEFAKKFNISEVYLNYQDLLLDKEVESVSVCTDHGSHAQITIDALNAKKHVIVEKPMALSLSDADAMIEASRISKHVLAVISQHRYTPEVRYIIDLINNDVFGEIVTICGTLNSHKDASYYRDSYWRGTLKGEGGSTLINQAIHTLDLIISIMDTPINVFAKEANLKFGDITETEDTIAGVFQFKNGALGTILSTNASLKFWESKIEIVASKGNITFTTGFPLKVTDLYMDDSAKMREIKARLAEYEAQTASDIPPTQDYYGVSHKYQLKNFINATRGQEDLLMPPKEARKTLSVVLRVYESSRR